MSLGDSLVQCVVLHYCVDQGVVRLDSCIVRVGWGGSEFAKHTRGS